MLKRTGAESGRPGFARKCATCWAAMSATCVAGNRGCCLTWGVDGREHKPRQKAKGKRKKGKALLLLPFAFCLLPWSVGLFLGSAHRCLQSQAEVRRCEHGKPGARPRRSGSRERGGHHPAQGCGVRHGRRPRVVPPRGVRQGRGHLRLGRREGKEPAVRHPGGDVLSGRVPALDGLLPQGGRCLFRPPQQVPQHALSRAVRAAHVRHRQLLARRHPSRDESRQGEEAHLAELVPLGEEQAAPWTNKAVPSRSWSRYGCTTSPARWPTRRCSCAAP